MKKFLLIIIGILCYQLALYSQAQGYYYFYYNSNGTCPTLLLLEASSEYWSETIPSGTVVKVDNSIGSVIYPFYSDGCSGQLDTTMILNEIGVSGKIILDGDPNEYVNYWWSPIVYPSGSYQFEGETHNTSMIRNSVNDPFSKSVQKIPIDAAVTLDSELRGMDGYTGNSVYWQFDVESGDIDEIIDVGNKPTFHPSTILHNFEDLLLDYTEKFIIECWGPYFPNPPTDGTDLNSTSRRNRQAPEVLGPFEFDFVDATLVNSGDQSCNGKIKVMISPREDRVINWRITINATEYSFSQNHSLTKGVKDTITITYDWLKSVYPQYNGDAIQIRGYYGSGRIPYTKPLTNIQVFPAISPFSITDTKSTCQDGTANGTISFNRTNANYDEVFFLEQYKNGAYEPTGDRLVVPPTVFSESFNGLEAGSYKVRSALAADQGSLYCPSTSVSPIIVDTLRRPVAGHYISTPWCENENASIVSNAINTNDGAGTLTYYLLDAGQNELSNNTSGSFSGIDLTTEAHFISVTDRAGCNSENNLVPMHEKKSIDFAFSYDEPLCNGEQTAKITFSGASGGPVGTTYQYGVDGAWTSSPEFEALFAGEHTISVRDNASPTCDSVLTITIPEPDKVVFDPPMYNQQNIDCFGGTGAITLFGSGGTGQLTAYLNKEGSADNLTVASPFSFSTLLAGTYDAWFQDASGCKSDTVKDIKITQNPKITIDDHSIKLESCKGTTDGTITINAVSGGVLGTSYTYNWDNGQTGPLATGLTAGTNYTLTLTDNQMCSVNEVLTLPSPPSIRVDFTEKSALCPGEGNGALIFNGITNGNPDYTYEVPEVAKTGDLLIGEEVSSLAPGNYTLYIYDALYNNSNTFSSCMLDTTFEIKDKEVLEIGAPVYHPPLCNSTSNGAIRLDNLSGPGEQGSYSYTWYDKDNNSISTQRNLTNIPAGTYSVLIRDAEGCEAPRFEDLILGEPDSVKITNIDIRPASCAEVANGAIELLADGGTGLLQYSIGASYQPSGIFANRASGDYILVTRDANGCTDTAQATIEAGQLAILLDSSTMLSCFNSEDGRIDVRVDGGSGSYTYNYNGPGWIQSLVTPFIDNVTAGIYTLDAQDNTSGCKTGQLVVDITQPDELVVKAILLDSASCGKPSGSLSHTITGGNGGNEIRWESSSFGSIGIHELNTLKSGEYTISVKDSKACSGADTIQLPERKAPEIISHTILDSTFCDKPLGTVQLLVSGGGSVRTYSWSHQEQLNSSQATGLVAGNYTVRVSDQFLCEHTYQFSLANGLEITPGITTSEPDCQQNNGSATINVVGGVAPYTFKWHDSITASPISNPSVDNLYAGSYTILVEDSVGCSKNILLGLGNTNGPELSLNYATKAWCDLPTGTASVSVTSSNPVVSSAWYTINGFYASQNSISDLHQGTYQYRVEDDAGCLGILDAIVGDSAELRPEILFVSMDSASCAKPLGRLQVNMSGGLSPYTYQWEAYPDSSKGYISNIPAGNYRVFANDARGCRDSMDLAVMDRLLPNLKILSLTDDNCGKNTGALKLSIEHGVGPYTAYNQDTPGITYPFTYSAIDETYVAEIKGLSASKSLYTYLATDGVGCTTNPVANYIDNSSPIKINLLEYTPVSCFGGSNGKIAIEVVNGIAPYTYAWSQNTVNDSVNNQLSEGKVNVKVTDASDCIVNSETYTITQPVQLEIASSIVRNPRCYGFCDGSIEVNSYGGIGTHSFTWNTGVNSQNLLDVCSGNYTLLLSDANNCKVEAVYSLEDPAKEIIEEIPESADVCDGQSFILDLGSNYSQINWTSDNGFSSSNAQILISEEGDYFVEAQAPSGCIAADTFTLVVSNNLLEAQFLMASEAYVGDTVVIIEVSWPEADFCKWNFPSGASLLTDSDYYKEIVFAKEGTYLIDMTANLANCVAQERKTIDVLNAYSEKIAYMPKEYQPLIKTFEVYPNPASSTINIEVELNSDDEVWLEMVNSTGKRVSRIYIGQGIGTYQLSRDVSTQTSGIYLLRLIVGGEIRTKLILVH